MTDSNNNCNSTVITKWYYNFGSFSMSFHLQPCCVCCRLSTSHQCSPTLCSPFSSLKG